MNTIYGTFFNDFTVQIIKPISNDLSEEEYAKLQFDKGFKRVSIISDDLIQVASFERKNEKENLYSVGYTVNTIQRKNGTAKKKTYQRRIYVYANNNDEAINHFYKLTNGKCYYEPKYEAENVIANLVNVAEEHTPCLMAV